MSSLATDFGLCGVFFFFFFFYCNRHYNTVHLFQHFYEHGFHCRKTVVFGLPAMLIMPLSLVYLFLKYSFSIGNKFKPLGANLVNILCDGVV